MQVCVGRYGCVGGCVLYVELLKLHVSALTGVPCVDIALAGSYGNYSVIECTTGPQPQPSTYYPGE